jgi:hypothetical protein
MLAKANKRKTIFLTLSLTFDFRYAELWVDMNKMQFFAFFD